MSLIDAVRKPDFVTTRWMCETYEDAQALHAEVKVAAVHELGMGDTGEFAAFALVETCIVEWEDTVPAPALFPGDAQQTAVVSRFAVDLVMRTVGT